MAAAKKVKRAFTNKDLRKFFEEKLRFNQDVLGLDYETALRWAKRSIGVLQEENVVEQTEELFP